MANFSHSDFAYSHVPTSSGFGGGTAAPARSVSEDGRSGAPAYRLDKRTYLDKEQGRYCVTVRDFGEQLAEIGWSFVPANIPPKSGKGLGEDRQGNDDRSARRAKSRIRQLILTAGADHLLTLTYRHNQTDFAQSCDELRRFVRLVKGRFPEWLYIGVPEKQKRGAWHWHLAVVGRQDVDFLRACWLRVIGEGNIDVKAPKRAGVAGNDRLGLVRYLCKYLSKGFKEGHRELNGRRFRASLGIPVPGVRILMPQEARGDVSAFVQDQLEALTGRVGFTWTADNGMAGWACSWK